VNTAKVYVDSNGCECSIRQMVEREPDWAASRIQVGEEALDVIALIKEWNSGRGILGLPGHIREKLQAMLL